MKNKVIVEDDIKILEALEVLFSTPYIHVETAINAEEALLAISSSASPWHCWIIDMNLGRLSGCAILEKHRQFPFTIIYSGIGSMEHAAEAKELGAAEVIDKKPDSILKLIVKICKLIPLSFLCKGFLPNDSKVFFQCLNFIRKNLSYCKSY
jgi:DNA-binding NtrC family response regulator